MRTSDIKVGQLVQVSYEPRPNIHDRTQWKGKMGLVTQFDLGFATIAFSDGDQAAFWPAELDLVNEAKDGMPSR